jgi:poly-beta-1,6-N-acetyl-D-glucosamine N-deacetylase PgaB
MRYLLALIGCGLLFGTVLAAEVPVLVYHDIRDVPGADKYVVTGQTFREQMAFLKRQGYQPISLRHFAEAAAGRTSLPEKLVVLSFDDGLVSFRDIAMPVLAEYGFPAVLSVVTGWIDGRQVPSDYRDRLLSWEQLRAVSRSPLVEVLSHTDNLHHGILANPQGNLTPASITRRYDAVSGQYESETAFRSRIRADLAHSAKRLRAELGTNPPGIAWPYGFYDQILAEEATALGMRYHLTLAEEPARLEQFPRINRLVLRDASTIAAFENVLLFERGRRPLRFIEVELDDMAGRSAAEQEKWLSALLPRLQLLRANAVVVNPFTRDGRYAFFQNNRIAVRAEVLHRFLHQVRTRAGIDFLLLRIPAIPGVAQAAPELARRHPYDGVVFAAGHSQAEAQALQRLFGYHHPGARCGREQGAAWPVCQDFMTVNMDLPVNASNPAVKLAASMPVYFLLQNQPDADGAQVGKALHGLRASGARDYGLRYGTFLENPANLRRVAAELAAQSIRGARN